MARHAKPTRSGGFYPAVAVAVLVLAWIAVLVYVDSLDSLRGVATVAVAASVVPLILLARSEARLNRAVAEQAAASRRSAATNAAAAEATDAELRRLHDELDRLTAEVATLGRGMAALLDKAMQPPVTVPAPAPAPTATVPATSVPGPVPPGPPQKPVLVAMSMAEGVAAVPEQPTQQRAPLVSVKPSA